MMPSRFTRVDGGEGTVGNLVFDIGMHRGNDSAFYLALGYRVVGIEANPDLAEFARRRFATEISQGKMTIVEGAVAEAGSGTVTFYRRGAGDGMGSIESRPGIPGFDAAEVTGQVEVPVVDLPACLDRYGTPHYMKVDIEGAEAHCLSALAGRPLIPDHLSVEADRSGWAGARAQVEELVSLGYNLFSLRPQSVIQGASLETVALDGAALDFTFEKPSSGPFGSQLNEAEFTSAEHFMKVIAPSARTSSLKLGLRKFKRIPGFAGLMSAAALRINRTVPLFEWYDIHARRSEDGMPGSH